VREAVRAIEAAGGSVTWDHEESVLYGSAAPPDARERAWRALANRHHDPTLDPHGLVVRTLLCPEWLHDVASVDLMRSSPREDGPGEGASPPEMLAAHLPAFPRLQSLFLLQATDRTLEAAGRLRGLETLVMAGDDVTDDGLRHLRGLSRLRRLEVSGARVTDAGVRHLTALENLESLALDETRLTDRALAGLLGLKGLKSLVIGSTRITEKGIEMLRAELPGIRLDR
jgi:hypothetical protein